MKRVAVALVAVARLALAQPAPAPVPAPAPAPAAAAAAAAAPGLSPDEEAALSKALGADAAANAKNLATAPPPTVSTAFGQSAFARAVQSMNPDLSVILDAAAGYYSANVVKSGDDPGDTGATLQELEIGFQATVDPYFKADVFLTIPNLQGIEVEEGYLTTTSLPWNLQLRAGMMRAAFGRQNTQHLHVQDFTRRPALNALLLGPDGLRAPGLELSWLAPLPFYLLLTVEVLSAAASGDPTRAQSFGGGARYDFTYLANARAFWPITDSTSAQLGLSFAAGKTSQQNPDPTMPAPIATDRDDRLYGADLYIKWKPPNVSRTYMSLAWTTEFLLREIPFFGHRLDGALYSQLAWQVARRVILAVRGEVDGIPRGAALGPVDALAVPRDYAGAGSLTFVFSEFARVRAYGEVRFPDGLPTNFAAFLQLEAAIGAHGAHPY